LKIKLKLTLEIILLIGLIGMVSFIAIINTKQVQNAFFNLSSETMPVLDTLKDMKLAGSVITATTMEIMLIEDEIQNSDGKMVRDLEEQIEFELFEMENGKALFTEAFTRYSIVMENIPDSKHYGDTIVNSWNNFIATSNKMVTIKNRGASGAEILQLKDEFEDAQQSVNKGIHSAWSFVEPQVDNEQKNVEVMVNNTTWSIIIALHVFIAASFSIRYLVVKSISKPLFKLRKATNEISQGNFVKTKIDGNDEISELGQDINTMSVELEKLNKEIVNSERLSSIGSLASRLAHDLRNPLSVIKNSMEILTIRLNPYMDEKIDHQLAMVGRAVSRMSHQIEDVLDFVNVADLRLESSSIISIVESALLSTDVPKSVKVNLPKNSATAICDPYRLEVVLSNIIKNASQAVNGKGEITVRIIDKENDVFIEIEDSGPGIPETVLPKIFEPLFTTKQTGTGLGLPSCKSIIQKHGGTISVRNNPTVFIVQIPKNPSLKKAKSKVFEKQLVNE
jgi:signal transduction histidine kinase